MNLLFRYVMENRIRIILFNISEDYTLYYSKCIVYQWMSYEYMHKRNINKKLNHETA